LEVAVDGNRLLLNFSSPLDNLVGFEHAPRNDKQTAAIQRMVGQLHPAAQQFAPTPEALCSPVAVTLDSPAIPPALLSAGAPAASEQGRSAAQKQADRAGEDKHASLAAEYVYRCERPDKLSGLDVRLFDAFPDIRRLDVQVAAGRKQAAKTLTTRVRRVNW